MITDTEKRAILSAVSRIAADEVRVQKECQIVIDQNPQASIKDLLEILVVRSLLTPGQAKKLWQLFPSLVSLQSDKNPPKSEPQVEEGIDQSLPFAPTLLALKEDDPTVTDEDAAPSQLGEYHILKKLGQGGMCPVYLGYHEKDQEKVAIKILPKRFASLQTHLDRFYREAKSGALLNHPNIVRNLTVGQDQPTGIHYLVLEYVDGLSARTLLERFHKLSVGDAVHIILDIARGLAYAHSRNVIHRDIKPDNILLTKTGIAKLADLGLAKRTDEASHLTAARQGFGTPHYMPYEQAINAKNVDGRSDIYALGATLYHLVTGETPFWGNSHVEIVDQKRIGNFISAVNHNCLIPDSLDQIINKMMAKDPKDRYQTVTDLISDLENSNLAFPVPTFVDTKLALQDPVLREKLEAAGMATCPDLRIEDNGKPPQQANPDIWYLRYQVQNGQWCKTRATTWQILKRLEENRIPKNIEASHNIQGEYHPLKYYPEFQSALNSPSRFESLRDHLTNWWPLYLGGGLVGIIIILVFVLIMKIISTG